MGWWLSIRRWLKRYPRLKGVLLGGLGLYRGLHRLGWRGYWFCLRQARRVYWVGWGLVRRAYWRGWGLVLRAYWFGRGVGRWLRSWVSPVARAQRLTVKGKWRRGARAWRRLSRQPRRGALPVVWVEYGRCCLRLDALDEARGALQRGLELQPESLPAWNLLAWVATEQGDWTAAADAWVECSRRHRHRGRAEEARDALEQALGLEPEHPPIAELLREAAIEREKQEKRNVPGQPGQQGEQEGGAAAAAAWLEYGHHCFHILGRLDEAKAGLERAVALQPDCLAAIKQLACIAAEEEDWPAAAAAWRRVLRLIEGSPEPSPPTPSTAGEALVPWAPPQEGSDFPEEHVEALLALSYAMKDDGQFAEGLELAERAAAVCRAHGLEREAGDAAMARGWHLLKLQRDVEAVEVFEGLPPGCIPPHPSFRTAYIRAFQRHRGRQPEHGVLGPGQLLVSYERGFLSRGGSHHWDLRIVDMLMHSRRLEAARRVYGRCFEVAAANHCFTQLLSYASALFHGAERERWHGKIRDRAGSMIEGGGDRPPTGSAAGVALALPTPPQGGSDLPPPSFPRKRESRVTSTFVLDSPGLGNKRRGNDAVAGRAGIKVFGIGLARTATTSLHEALVMLGLRGAHFITPDSRELIGEADIVRFDALSDAPIAYCFEALYEKYPDARFIYTGRPLGAWAASFLRHIQMWHGVGDYAEFRRLLLGDEEIPYGKPLREMYRALYASHETPEAAYAAHESRVRTFFAARPQAKFLEMDITKGDGWEKLTAFLGLPIPNEDFPCANPRLSLNEGTVIPAQAGIQKEQTKNPVNAGFPLARE